MILNYFKGNKHHHVERARTLLAQHRLSNEDIVRDLSRLKLLISNLAQAQGSDLPEMQKFGILRDLMKNEQRPVVIQTFHYACLQKLSFDEAVASLIEMCSSIPIEGLKMAAVITSAERYCFKFQLDKSTDRKCRFIHQLMNEQQKKESGFDKNRPDMKNYDMKSNNKDKKFKGKRDTRNNKKMGCIIVYP